LAFDNGYPFAGLGGLNSSALPAGSRTDHDQVIRQKSPRQALDFGARY
jgi:hypothetical protein